MYLFVVVAVIHTCWVAVRSIIVNLGFMFQFILLPFLMNNVQQHPIWLVSTILFVRPAVMGIFTTCAGRFMVCCCFICSVDHSRVDLLMSCCVVRQYPALEAS